MVDIFYVDATIGIKPLVIDAEANNTIWNSLRKKDFEAQVAFTLKVMERVGLPVIDVPVKNDSLLFYAFKLFKTLKGRYSSVLVRERE